MAVDRSGIVDGVVVKVTSAGLHVRLGGDHTAFVPRRELTWNHVQARVQAWHVGQPIKAVWTGEVLPSGAMSLSVRQLMPDPWIAAVDKYRVGQTVQGRVYAFFRNGTYFQIEEGVAGLIYLDGLGPTNACDPKDWVGIGDAIRATIDGVNNEHRNFLCDMRKRLTRILAAPLRQECVADGEEQAHLIEASPSPYSTGALRILIIDDDEDFCRSAERAFSLAGHTVVCETRALKGIDAAVTNVFDVIAVDLVQPEMSGIEICKAIRIRVPDANTVIFTGEVAVDGDQLSVLNPPPLVVRKPFDVADIEAAALGEVRDEEMLVPQQQAVIDDRIATRVYEDHPDGPEEIVCEDTEAAAERLSATSWGVFEWLEREQRVVALNVSHFKTGEPRDVANDANHSFIRNVAGTGETVWCKCLAVAGPSFQKWCMSLTRWLDFQSILCVPVLVKNKPRFAMLLSSVEPDAFDATQVEWLETRAEATGLKVEAWEAYRQLERIQRFALRGQLTASLTHELRNRLNTLSLSLSSIASVASDSGSFRNMNEDTYLRFTGSISDAVLAYERIGDVLAAFSETREEGAVVSFDVAEVIETVATRLRPQAKRLKVALDLDRVRHPLSLLGSPARLGQVIENLILNALQHTSAYRLSGNGLVSVLAHFVEETPGCHWLHIQVQDNGPGIHASDYERIFEMGYSTRPNGLGVGLALCKATTESLGGTVSVAQSIVFEGTVMLVRIPVSQTGGGR